MWARKRQEIEQGLDIPALDLFGQRLDDVGDALHARIDRECAAIDFQRLLVVADVLQDQPEAGLSAPKWRGSRLSTSRMSATECP